MYWFLRVETGGRRKRIEKMSSFDYKTLTDKQLETILSDVKFKVKPMRHQAISLAFAVDEDRHRVAFFHDVGTGKTIAALATAWLWGVKKILVVCPNSAFAAWKRDIKKATKFSYTLLSGSTSKRLQKLSSKKDVYVINFEGLKVVYANLLLGKGWIIDKKRFTDGFDCIIVDEVHKCKNYKSLQSRICFELSRRADYCIALTGTPIDSSMLELFNIYKVIDLGRSLGLNFFIYRNRFFKKGFFDWKLKPDCKEKILDNVSNCTMMFNREECFDLPDAQTIERPISSSKGFLRLQDTIMEEEVLILDGFGDVKISSDNPAVKGQWLRELSGGFMYFKEGDSHSSYRLSENPKLEALIDIIEDMKSKVVVFHNFVEEGRMIEETLERNGILFSSLRGEIPERDRGKQYQQFVKHSGVRVMVAHPICAGESYDFSVANVEIFYSPIASPKIRKQAEGRIYRKGQERKVLFIDLILENSIDAKINENRAKRKSLVDSVTEYMQSYRKYEENIEFE